MAEARAARTELVLGGQKSGKTARAEGLAAAWLAHSPGRRAIYIATAQAHDAEMHERIQRHQRERAARVPGMMTVEEPLALPGALATHARSDTLVVVDCLTLWLTAMLMPAVTPALPAAQASDATEELAQALVSCAGPVVLVSNEIGLGVVPMGREVRAFVDALGRLNQRMAQSCECVTLMAAGLPLALKEPR